MNDVRRFVKIEFVGGPWDGKEEVRDYPLDGDRVCVPLLQPTAAFDAPAELSAEPAFRVGEYRRDWTGRFEEMFDVHAISLQLLASSRLHPSQMAAYSLERKRPIVFKWEGE